MKSIKIGSIEFEVAPDFSACRVASGWHDPKAFARAAQKLAMRCAALTRRSAAKKKEAERKAAKKLKSKSKRKARSSEPPVLEQLNMSLTNP